MTSSPTFPRIIQGGMGVAVSNWRLANAVARVGQLGVVSGTMLDTVLVRRLQDGDPGGHVRRAIAQFPIPDVGDEVVRRYFRPEGRPAGTPYRALPMYKQAVSDARQRVTVLANFVEVWLAKEGHLGPIGVNLLTKVQMPNLAVAVRRDAGGGGLRHHGRRHPSGDSGRARRARRASPGAAPVRDRGGAARRGGLARLRSGGALARAHGAGAAAPSAFLAVISAASLALTLARKSTGRVDGFVVEGPTAGGHNAPPRGELRLDARGQPLYGERDAVDLAKLRDLGLPFWLAGGVGSPEGLRRALAEGATGIQVGTLFAYAEESGIEPALKARVRQAVVTGEATLRTDPRASPTGYPFKVVALPDDAERQARRRRVCDLGYLRVAARTADGRTVYRCSAEPVDAYVAKGGSAADTEGRRCLCNGLTATVGLAQQRATEVGGEVDEEMPLVTSGDDLLALGTMFSGRPAYTAADVVAHLCA